ncbi:MAG TPA: thiolase family protein [Actinomycetota bacterium]|nr:thiolase family protein [Actinomycetota bacterium]
MPEAVIVGAVRTAIGRRGGKLTGWHPTDLLAATLNELVNRTGIDPAMVDDVICGCVSQVGEQALNIARDGWLAAGLPESVPATTVDRQCGSSQQAAHFAAQGVLAGAYDLAVACGVEHMTRVPLGTSMAMGVPFTPALLGRYEGGLVPQGVSAELLAADFELSREDLDTYGMRSHAKAAAATLEGRFRPEIFPLKVDGANGSEVFETDEGIRYTADPAKIASLPTPFFSDDTAKQFPEIRWVVTAGNSSQISDGASAVLIATPEKAAALGLRPRARFVSFAVAGSDPIRMLTGPIPATKRVLERAGLALSDIDVVEINEAFASVVLGWKKALGVDDEWFEEHVNPNGGAISLGHPLGASGARLLTTLLHELERRGGRYGLQTMCEGGGMANATIIERLDG